mgnify:CR=1 FL=1
MCIRDRPTLVTTGRAKIAEKRFAQRRSTDPARHPLYTVHDIPFLDVGAHPTHTDALLLRMSYYCLALGSHRVLRPDSY